MTYAVIMAGGSGTRFWPKSTSDSPKQFLKLFGDRTMIQSTADRLTELIPEKHCMVVTAVKHVETVKKQLPDIPDSQIIGEVVARNTAPCVAAAARILLNRDPDAVMAVLPADHLIRDEEEFRAVLKSAVQAAEQNRSLVTIGIRPTRPETGYGYIHFESPARTEYASHPVHKVLNFTEKPEEETARAFVESGDYLWNSGMFIWRADTILEMFQEYQSEIYKKLDYLKGSAQKEDIDRFYKECPSISVDYGIMEHAEKVEVLPADFGWDDVGSWAAVHKLSDKDGAGNAISAKQSFVHDSEGNLVQSESGKFIALVGVSGFAVVETEDAILVCDMNRAQDVKKVVEELEKKDSLKRFL